VDSQQKMKDTKLLIIIVILSLSVFSCSKTSRLFNDDIGKAKFEEKITSKIEPKWFASSPERFVLEQRDHSVPAHHFFDAPPSINYNSQSVNFVIETPARSSREYLIDLKSGRHFFNQNYCQEKDHSTKSSEIIKTPPFHIGIVPRVFDQMGKPQRILVFGGNNIIDFKEKVFTAKVVGGFVLGECLYGKCTRQQDWGSRLVMIGVKDSIKVTNRTGNKCLFKCFFKT